MAGQKRIRAADLFAGAGGTSVGLTQACEETGARLKLTAVNHWEVAIETHSQNHPKANHLCADLDSIHPLTAVPGGRLDLLVASPECAHYSRARGGKPVSDQKRASPWCVVRWATDLQPRAILVENVREFQEWGPITTEGKPLKRRKGEYFTAWVGALKALGYSVSWRVLNAADYGDATTRERLFVVARRSNKPFLWPEPSHARAPETDLFGAGKPRWRSAREVIDWTLQGKSIFGRKTPLRENTLRRIEAGLRRFGGEAAEPFLVLLRGTDRAQVEASARSPDEPVPTICAQAEHIGVCEPILLHTTHGGREHSVSDPVPTVTGANRGELALVQPFLCSWKEGIDRRTHDINDPLNTVTATDRFGLVVPCHLDILFRMLQATELAAAMSFPAGYKFAGKRKADVIRQIGNAVPTRLARALCLALLAA